MKKLSLKYTIAGRHKAQELKEENSMKFIPVVIFGLSLIMGACDLRKGDLEIDIGDYEGQLAAWNSQNMLDYQINGSYDAESVPLPPFISTVKNGILKSGFPSSTIPELYSLIKSYEKELRDLHNSGDKRSLSLKVSYNTEYHYPSKIVKSFSNRHTLEDDYSFVMWRIALNPLGELEIDIGDYEGQLAAWNSQNMLDYQIVVAHDIISENISKKENGLITVRNGIRERDDPSLVFATWPGYTIPEFYSFIERQEKGFKDWYNRDNSMSLSLKVSYNTESHYPSEIILEFYSYSYTDYTYRSWEITLIPLEETKQKTEGGEE